MTASEALRLRVCARLAEADQVEAMAHAREPSFSGELIEGPIELTLQRGRDVEVLHPAAPRTHQVVVVSGQFLGELVPGEAVLGGDPPDESGCLELRQVPIRGALRQVLATPQDVGEGKWHACSREYLHEPPPRVGVSLPRGRQSRGDLLMELHQ